MTNNEKGHLYEQFVCDHLNAQPDTIAYLWENIPDEHLIASKFVTDYAAFCKNRSEYMIENCANDPQNNMCDLGIDILIYNTKTNTYTFGQCKNYENSKLCLKHLGGFFGYLAQPTHLSKNGVIYVPDTDNVTRHVKSMCDGIRIAISHIKMPIQKHDDIKIPIQTYTPYQYQLDCCKKFRTFYNNNNKNGILSMPPGTGKTYASYLISKRYNLIQYCVQNLENFKKFYNDRQITTILINSNGTREIKKINATLETGIENQKIIIAASYASADIVRTIVDNVNNDNYSEYASLDTFIIIDEFHNLSHNNLFNEKNDMNKIIRDTSIAKLFMSATPKTFDNNVIENDVKLGEIVYSMSFVDAIKNNYIANYEVYIPTINTVADRYSHIGALKVKGIAKSIIDKVYYYFEIVKKCGKLRTIIYFPTSVYIKNFIECFKIINTFYDYDAHIDMITCEDSQKGRTDKLKMFADFNGLSILCAVRILDECIDIPTCDSVYISYEYRQKIGTIQRICRCLRKHGNKVGKIILWSDCAARLQTTINIIADIDGALAEKVKIVDYCKKVNSIATFHCVTDVKKLSERLRLTGDDIDNAVSDDDAVSDTDTTDDYIRSVDCTIFDYETEHTGTTNVFIKNGRCVERLRTNRGTKNRAIILPPRGECINNINESDKLLLRGSYSIVDDGLVNWIEEPNTEEQNKKNSDAEERNTDEQCTDELHANELDADESDIDESDTDESDTDESDTDKSSTKELDTEDQYTKISMLEPFDKSLRVLSICDNRVVTDVELKSCDLIEELYITNNPFISKCYRFAKSLRVLSIVGDSGIDDDSLALCRNIEILSITDNEKITMCHSFAKSLRILCARSIDRSCNMCDYGLKLCESIEILYADNNENITSCAPFANRLLILFARYKCGINDDGLKKCKFIENLYATNNVNITTCKPFAKTLRMLCASFDCGIDDKGLYLCESITHLYANNNKKITTCYRFATSLRLLDARSECGINDQGLYTCNAIEELDADNNKKITTCKPFAKSLCILHAASDCGINDDGLESCRFIDQLYVDNNPKITRCNRFAKTLRMLSATCECGIGDYGLSSCKVIEILYADDNKKITTCNRFANSLHILHARSKCGINDKGLRLCTSIRELNITDNKKITTCVPFRESLRVVYARDDHEILGW